MTRTEKRTFLNTNCGDSIFISVNLELPFIAPRRGN